MSNPLISIYRFFRRYRLLFILFCILFAAAIIFFAGKVRLEEDVTGMTGTGKKGDDFGYVTTHFTFADKLIIHFFPADTNLPSTVTDLTSIAREFCDSLRSGFDSASIRSVAGNIPDSGMISFLGFISGNLPIFLEDRDYDRIREMISPESIDSILEKKLQNPGLAGRIRYERKDPHRSPGYGLSCPEQAP